MQSVCVSGFTIVHFLAPANAAILTCPTPAVQHQLADASAEVADRSPTIGGISACLIKRLGVDGIQVVVTLRVTRPVQTVAERDDPARLSRLAWIRLCRFLRVCFN